MENNFGLDNLLSFETQDLSRQLSNLSPWPPRLPFDLALGIDGIDILSQRYDLTRSEIEAFSLVPSFRMEVDKHLREIRENGVSFKEKAKVQAEEYLMKLHDIVVDPDAPASVRLDGIKSVVKWAGYEPKETKEGQAQQPQFNIQINL